MNKSYLYANGNIHVFDEDNKKRVIDYTDNFEDVLIKENKIEFLEKTVYRNTEYLMNIYEKNVYYNIYNFVRTLSFGSTGYVGTMLTDYLLKLNLDDIYGTKMIPTLMSLSAVLVGYNLGKKDKDYVNNKRIIEGREKAYKELEKMLKEEKREYDILKSNKTRILEQEFNGFKFEKFEVEDEEELKKIMDIYKATLNYGTNKNAYLKYYKKGILEEELEEYNSLAQIRIIENYIEDEFGEKIKKKGRRR